MKKMLFLLVFFIYSLTLVAQQDLSGQVTYEQLVDNDFGNYKSDPAWEAYVSDLPKQTKSTFILNFSGSASFYEIDISNQAATPEKLQNALAKGSYGKGPQVKTQQVFYDFENGIQTEQVEFMTRNFQVTSDLNIPAWKLTSKRKKVLDYVCFGAELIKGEEVYTAWFTSEIPVSTGPAGYYGLPGLVLAVEKNEEVFILATEVNLSATSIDLQSKLNEGKSMTKAEFDKTVIEKEEEFKASVKNKKVFDKK